MFVLLFWFNARCFTISLTKDLCARMIAKDWSGWRWAFSFYGVENWLLLRIMCGTKRLNPFFRLHEASEVPWLIRSARVSLLLPFFGWNTG